MIGTYAAVAAICVSSLAIGQAAVGLCGGRSWSWLSPAVGLALLCAICWGTVRMPGDGMVSALVVLVLTVASGAWCVAFLPHGREESDISPGQALRIGGPVALGALLAASLPFIVEGHFGILGTSFNPDMSQHLLAADRLAEGHSSQLLNQGYPLGPHAIVVALNKGLGIGLVQGFSGLTIAVAVLASLTALAAFRELPALPRTAGALLVGLTYITASYLAQGAFKETMQALYLLAFVLALRESDRTWSDLQLRYVPAALIAVGSIYTYSFPSLIWLGPAFVLWAAAQFVCTRAQSASAAGGTVGGTPPEEALATGRGGGSPAVTGPAARALGPSPFRALGLALVVFLVLSLPELSRMLDFHSFETFDPNGPGLGNLFGQISPFEVLGIWPSGDFRLAPGDGAVPALGYYLGIAFGLVLLAYGVVQLWRRREAAILAGLGAAALAYAAARVAGTPYTAAKAIEIAAPLVALTILRPLLFELHQILHPGGRKSDAVRPGSRRLGAAIVASLFAVGAGVCSLLALANAPVGPTSYSSKLSEYRRLVGAGPTLVYASPQLLDEEHGEPFLAWELRGGQVCIHSADEPKRLPGVRFVIGDEDGWTLQRVQNPLPGKSPCPLIAERQARQGPAR
ncbi:MAG TPA: hypothetical protein VHP56_02455 [Solirubrobacterales bacterium]|nr:hypothetical protein [Solirubrobacterales bacterium]